MLMRVAQAKVNPLVARAVPVTLTQREKPSSEAVASPPTRRFFLAFRPYADRQGAPMVGKADASS